MRWTDELYFFSRLPLDVPKIARAMALITGDLSYYEQDDIAEFWLLADYFDGSVCYPAYAAFSTVL